MKADRIVEEIKQLEARLADLKENLTDIQQNCEHQYLGNQYVETCVICRKVNVLYY